MILTHLSSRCLKRYRLLSYLIAVGMEGLCCVFIPLLHTYPLLVSWAVLYGYFDGAYVALIPVVASDVVGPAFLTSALGVVYFLHGIPYLISPPIGGTAHVHGFSSQMSEGVKNSLRFLWELIRI